jgi:thiamine biosynthesis lipoprotein
VTTTASGLDRARDAAADSVTSVDLACSRFIGDSELSALNRGAGSWVPVGEVLLDALEAAIWAARVTEGAVDLTVGRALRIVGYDRDFAALPADGSPIPLRAERVPGWHVVEVDRRHARARLAPGSEIDLGSTAKALAADRAAGRALAALGGGGVLVSLGGDIAVAGQAPPGGWPILVAEEDSAPLDGPGEVVLIESGGLATSSTLVRRWSRGGVSLHHIIDPATGLPARGPWRTVTVAAATCLEANVAATAAVVMGERAEDWLRTRGLPALLIGDGGRTARVAGWPGPAGEGHRFPSPRQMRRQGGGSEGEGHQSC